MGQISYLTGLVGADQRAGPAGEAAAGFLFPHGMVVGFLQQRRQVLLPGEQVVDLQQVKALNNGTVRTMKVCTRCIRSGAVTKVV